MQRREFLQSTLALGAAAMLSNGELTSGHPPQDVTLPATTVTDSPPPFSLGVAPQGFPLDMSVTFNSRQGISVTLRYNEKTMSVPVVLEKRDPPLIFEVYTRPLLVRRVLSIFVNRQEVIKDSLDKQDCIFRIEATVENNTLIAEQGEQYESVIQDIFDHVDVGDVIPEKHYESIADFLTRVYNRCQNQRSQGVGEVLSGAGEVLSGTGEVLSGTGEVLSQEEVERLLNMMSNQS